MAERMSREEREALIVGDAAASLRADQAAEVTVLADLLADPSTWAEPRPGLEDAVLEAVAHAAVEPAVGDAHVAPADVVSMPRRAGASWWRVAAAAAAVVVVVAAGALVLTRDRNEPGFRAQLAATDLAPQAGGSVDISENAGGFRVDLDATGLPPLSDGQYYQAWLKEAGGTLVAIGTFSSSDDAITLWSGVSPADFPTMTVTIEDADGQQASSGQVVLKGEVAEP